MKGGVYIKRTISLLLCSFLFALLYSPCSQAEELSIQERIDEANPGDVIKITEGTYNENLVITKPIHLIGSSEVILTSNNEESIITIQANDVTIEQLTLDYDSDEEESSAVLVNGNNNLLNTW